MAETFITDIITKAIKSCRNSKAFGTDKLSIFHLKNIGPRAIEYITALFVVSTHSLDPCLSIIAPLVHQPAYLSIWLAAPSLQRGLTTNPGVTGWCICRCS